METNNFNHAVINKNRGWRGLAEVRIRDEKYKDLMTMVFSFSQPVWSDLIVAKAIVLQDEEFYYVVHFNSTDCETYLPKPTQQRSVLIKNATLRILEVNKVAKAEWTKSEAFSWSAITHFIKNRNNHTTSDWNCIGVRVIPEI